MPLHYRAYQTDVDYWNIRSFLREVFLLNHRREYSWTLARFDYWFWYGIQVFERHWFNLHEGIFLWETDDGHLAALLNPEGQGEVFFQVHPEYCTPELLEEMLAVAEGCLSAPQQNGKNGLQVWAVETDTQLQGLLTRRGYLKKDGPEYMRRRSLDTPILEGPLPPGYNIRSIRCPEDTYARSLAGWQAFHPPEVPIAPEFANGEWLLWNQRIPIYRSNLDLVVTSPVGEIAAFTTVWYDDVTRTGYFEPVGTVPAYQRKGLGKAVVCEGLRRLKALGGDLALVGSYSPEAGSLYAAMGFTEYDLLEPWGIEVENKVNK